MRLNEEIPLGIRNQHALPCKCNALLVIALIVGLER